ncbi:MAG: DUF427 domain-containing protein [Bacteroidota bacterium]
MPNRIEPGPNQESVWDYPRPPRLERTDARIRVVFNGATIVDTTRSYRVLETSHPPVYYSPPGDIADRVLHETARISHCEFKGRARYYDVAVDAKRAEQTAWAYPNPTPRFQDMAGYVAFYAHLMDACYVDDEQVDAQDGSFYGGWITSRVVGPFKGSPGTIGW